MLKGRKEMDTLEKKSITIKVAPDVKAEAEELLQDMGLNITTLFTMTLHKLIAEKQLPFQPKARSKMDRVADDIRAGRVESASSLEEMWERLDD
jgi:addiction module RelB/DinJ family antitoxin